MDHFHTRRTRTGPYGQSRPLQSSKTLHHPQTNTPRTKTRFCTHQPAPWTRTASDGSRGLGCTTHRGVLIVRVTPRARYRARLGHLGTPALLLVPQLWCDMICVGGLRCIRIFVARTRLVVGCDVLWRGGRGLESLVGLVWLVRGWKRVIEEGTREGG